MIASPSIRFITQCRYIVIDHQVVKLRVVMIPLTVTLRMRTIVYLMHGRFPTDI